MWLPGPVEDCILNIQKLFEETTLDDLQNLFTRNIRTCLVIGTGCVGLYWLLKKPKGLPPGPRWTLPILGDMLTVVKKSDKGDPRLAVRRLRQKYGDIYSVYMGPKLFIVISGYSLIKDALLKHGDIFSERPKFFMFDKLAEGKGIIGSSGQLWKEQRKFALETLREFGFGRSILEDKIHEEIEILIASLLKQNGQAYNIYRIIQSSVSNVICSLVFGKRFEYNDPLFLKYLEKVEENFAVVGSSGILNMMPLLRFLPGDPLKYNRTMDNVKFVEDTFINSSIEDHFKNYDENNTDDFIASYIKEMKKEEAAGIKSSLDKKNLVKSIGDLFVAGTETTSTAILWTILYWLHYPQVYQKCYKEVQDVIGSGRLPSMKDKPNMPYNEAVMLEILRLTNITVVGVPHGAVSDTIYQGYLIPKDATLMPNIDSVLSSDEIWGDADVFRPERFIDGNGQVIRRDELIPFSIGRRVCLGEALAKMELFLFLTTLIQRFDFQPVDPKNLPTLVGTFGATHAPVSYEVRVIPRK